MARYHVPGRINLIGEHTDYNNGFVLPGAVNLGFSFEIKASTNDRFTFYSERLQQQDSCLRDGTGYTWPWMRYFSQTLQCFVKKGLQPVPLSVRINGNLPSGAGMSSSSALTCGLIYAINDWNNFGISSVEMVRLASEAENGTGLDGGMMDQFAIIHSKKDHLLLLDCKDLNYEWVKSDFDPYEIVLFDTRVEHSLLHTEYNSRARDCRNGLAIIKSNDESINSFRDLSLPILLKYQDKLSEDSFKRLEFVVRENTRVLQAVEAIKLGKMKLLGKLLNESHDGLRNRYEVSCPELDFIVNIVRSYPGALGSRMMGGGFGGCTIQLVEQRNVEELFNKLSQDYFERFGWNPIMYRVSLEDGIRRIN